MRHLERIIHAAIYALLVIGLAACGGGGSAQHQAADEQAQVAVPPAGSTMRALAVTVGTQTTATELVVRAHGVIAANVGPIMEVRVDGVVVGSAEVRATEPSDYRFAVPALRPGAKVDVFFTNDGVFNGVDRNLHVSYLIAGNTFVLPTAADATYDRGAGTEAFDGVNVVPGQAALVWGGALRLTWPAVNMTERLTVRASSTLAGDVGPIMQVRVDGVTVGSTEVRTSQPTDFVFATPPLTANSRVDVVYNNHGQISGVTRSLNVAYLLQGKTVLLPTSAGVIFDQGSGPASFDSIDTLTGRNLLTANGALRAKWPAVNMTDTLTVRASGRLAGNVGPIMQVVVDGVMVGSTEVRSTTPADYSFAVLPMRAGSQVDVVYTNDAVVNGEDRELAISYLIADKTFLLPTSTGVVYDQGSGNAAFDGVNTTAGHSILAADGALRASWPTNNMTEKLTVRAKGSMVSNVGPVMQIYVDGVMVGSSEVRSADFSDFTFWAPPLRTGSKVDVAFVNDAYLNGEDRNLFVAYMISGNTFVLPNAPNVLYDRGAGRAAFDNIDVVAGQSAVIWGGALRTTWPAPNITDTITVRASGTLAANVGPIMQVWVDGVAVSSVEVRSTTPADYVLAVPKLKPGSRVDLVFSNFEVVDGQERRLQVQYLLSGNTVLLTSAAGVTFAPGTDNAALNSGERLPGQTVLATNGALRAVWPTPNLTDTLTVRAHGVIAANVGPIMEVRVDGVVVGSAEVRATEPSDYRFAVPALRPGAKVDVFFTNDGVFNGVDRNLHVSYLIAGNTFVLPTAADATYDRGAGTEAFDGVNVVPGQAALVWGGALRLTWPAVNMTERLTVRASSTLAGDVGPIMQVRVDGVTVGSTEVRTSQPTDFVFATPPLTANSRVDVVYNNHGQISGVTRSLNVAYLLQGKTVLLPTSAGVIFDQGSGPASFDSIDTLTGRNLLTANGALRAKWPAVNMTDTLTVRASGRLAGNVGPIMQVVVDGVMVGSTEVRSTTPADYSFAVLPMRAGSQVDVVYTNDAVVNGEDRELAISYLIADKTFLLPTSTGVVYDQGSGNAAFDGVNTTAGHSILAADGALRASWPTNNMTEKLTVRAKGSMVSNVGPVMQIYVDGVMVGSSEVRSADFSDFTFWAPPLRTGSKVDVAFVNDAYLNGEDRNLFVAYMISGNTFVLPNAPNVLYDRGAGRAAFDNIDVVAGQSAVIWGGALRTTWPAPNITDTITVRASGTLAANVGPIMQVWVDGVAVSSVEVRSTTPADYVLAVPKLKPGSRVDLVFSNHAILAGENRNLKIDYVLAGQTVVRPTSPLVTYDIGIGNAAFDGSSVLPGQSLMSLNGALRVIWPSANLVDSIVIRASATMAANIGAVMQVRIDGVIVGTVEVRSPSAADYVFATPAITAGTKIDVAFINDYQGNGEDRNLLIQYVRANGMTLAPWAPYATIDVGLNESAFDGMGVSAGSSALASNGSLRFVTPNPTASKSDQAASYAAARFLQQATFGATLPEINRLATMTFPAWIDEQMSIPATSDYVTYIQSKYDLGDAYRPKGAHYTTNWVADKFWSTAATGQDQLRRRVALALHQIFIVSQLDSNLYYHTRAYAAYLDALNRHAFGNYRNLLEEIALSPAMGIYLSHMRNRKEDPATGRLPDENFAREIMQLFSIGLHELNVDGTPKLDGKGMPIETYSNEDVMALAKVFTGWGWAFPDNQLTEVTFRWGQPDYSSAADTKVDLKRMKPYPGMHSQAEKRLFAGKENAALIPANSTAEESLRIALNTLFNHPNVGPFIGRQLIQRLVTSHPSAAYVARVAAKFNNNGNGVRGDLGAVVRAILLDPEARLPQNDAVKKLKEPILRVSQWMRGLGATSSTGQYMMAWELDNQSQRALFATSVFGYFRPGYVPPNTVFASNGVTVPEFQIVSESSTALWANLAMSMVSTGVGWTGTGRDVSATLAQLTNMAANGQVDGLIEHLNLILLAGRMTADLRQSLVEAVAGVSGSDVASNVNRARVALYIVLTSPEFMVQQ